MGVSIRDKELTVVEKQTLTQAVLSIMNDTIAVNEPIFKGYSQYSTINNISQEVIMKSGFNAVINHMINSKIAIIKGIILAKPNTSIKGLLGNLHIGVEFTLTISGEISYSPTMLNIDVEPTEWIKTGLFNATETDGAFYLGQLTNIGEVVEEDIQPKEVIKEN